MVVPPLLTEERVSVEITADSNTTKDSYKCTDEAKLKNSIRKREIKLVKIIRLNVFFFCVAWLPYAFVTLYAQYGPKMIYFITPWTTSIPAVMAKLSSVYNPIIYVVTSKDCKKYIQAQFTKRTFLTGKLN